MPGIRVDRFLASTAIVTPALPRPVAALSPIPRRGKTTPHAPHQSARLRRLRRNPTPQRSPQLHRILTLHAKARCNAKIRRPRRRKPAPAAAMAPTSTPAVPARLLHRQRPRPQHRRNRLPRRPRHGRARRRPLRRPRRRPPRRPDPTRPSPTNCAISPTANSTASSATKMIGRRSTRSIPAAITSRSGSPTAKPMRAPSRRSLISAMSMPTV